MAAPDGVMSYPVSLQNQCYMFIVGHLEELPSDVMALLPIGIRRKLLLMLPALDVCKLEETPVTDGISMDDEIWKLKCKLTEHQRFKFGDITLTWKDSYFQITQFSLQPDELLLPSIGILNLSYCACTGNIQGLIFCEVNIGRAGTLRAVVLNRYKTYTYRPQYCDYSELLKLLADSNISFKAIDLETFLRKFVGFEIPVECVPLLEKLLNSVVALEIKHYYQPVELHVIEKLLSIIFTNPSCHVKCLTVCGPSKSNVIQLLSTFITNNPHCKLKEIKLDNIRHHIFCIYDESSLDMLYCILDNQDQLEKLEIYNGYNFKYSIFSRPTFKKLTIHGDISMDSYVYILQQFFLSPYPVTLKLHRITIPGHHCLQIPSVQSHPTQHSKTLKLNNCWQKILVECLPSTIHLKKLVILNYCEYFSRLDNIIVDECITVSTDTMNDLNKLFQFTTAKEWNIEVTLSEDMHTQDKFILALTNIKGVVTKLHINRNRSLIMSSIILILAEAIFTTLRSSLPQLVLDLPAHGCQSSDVRELYEIWKQCGSIQLKKLTLRGYHDNDDTVRDIVALISKFDINCSDVD